jgi:hypothetical protein
VLLGYLAATGVAVLIYLVECVLFFGMNAWYWTLGPALHREEWQTDVSVEKANQAIREALHLSPLVVRDRGKLFCFHRKWWQFGAWPRASLQSSDGPNGAVLIYEIRPFVSMALVTLPALIWFFVGRTRIDTVLVLLLIPFTYFYYWKRELRSFSRLGPVRRYLRVIGVFICENCGYDLHGRTDEQPCPECGKEPVPE